jgi:hypothetical protein
VLKLNVNVYVKKFRISQISLSPLAVLQYLIAFLKPQRSYKLLFQSRMGAIVAFKPPGSVHIFSGCFRKAICSSRCEALEQLLHITARGFREISENYNTLKKVK